LVDESVAAGVAENDIILPYGRFLFVEINLVNEFSGLAGLETVDDSVRLPEIPALLALLVQKLLFIVEIDEPSDKDLLCFHDDLF
jgi:hypothetical protein